MVEEVRTTLEVQGRREGVKCGYMAIVIDEYGYRSSFDANLQALTKHGLMRVPKYDQSEVFVDLGVPRVVLQRDVDSIISKPSFIMN